MQQPVIEINNLSKKFKDVHAVNDLDLTVYQGDIFGFLGPNGAGKSTTIRMLLSLIEPDNGTINIFGKEMKSNRQEIFGNVGAIVEKPDFYGYLSAYKNLEILAKISGRGYSRNRIMEILELVGLEKRYKHKVKTFSHGMRQRLGLAQALIHDPQLIILDEPTTGLDPQGMKEIRDLIIKLSKEQNKTILLSSHILYEVELIATRMIIINKGKKIVEGSVQELLDANNVKVIFEVNEYDHALSLINESRFKDYLDTINQQKFLFKMNKIEIPLLNKYLVENNINVTAISPTRSLEQYFLNITEGEGK